MKEYIQSLTVTGVSLAVAIWALITAIEYVLLNRKKDKYIVFLVSFFYIYIMLLEYRLEFLPYVPDAEEYIKLIGGSEGKLVPKFNLTDSSYWFYIAYTPVRIFGGSVAILTVINIKLFSYACMLSYKATEEIYSLKHKSTTFIYIATCVVWPSGIHYIISPTREPVVIFIWFSLIWSLFVSKKKYPKVAYIVMFSMVMVMFRVEFLPLVILTITIYYLSNKSNDKVISVVAALFSLATAYYLTQSFGILEKVSPEKISKIKEYRYKVSSGGNLYEQKPDWSSWLDVVSDLPRLVTNLLLSPIPFDNFSFSRLASTVDAIFVFLVFVSSFPILYRNFDKIKPKTYTLVVILYILSVSVYEYHITGAVRHRMPVVLMVLPLSSAFLAETTNRLSTPGHGG